MAAVLGPFKFAAKLAVGGLAVYGLSEVLGSQDNSIKQISYLDHKTRENVPFNLPEFPSQTKVRHSWNQGVQKVFTGLEQAPDAAWELGTKGVNATRDFLKEQMK